MNDDRGQRVTVWSEGPILPPSLTEHVEKLNFIDDDEYELSYQICILMIGMVLQF